MSIVASYRTTNSKGMDYTNSKMAHIIKGSLKIIYITGKVNLLIKKMISPLSGSSSMELHVDLGGYYMQMVESTRVKFTLESGMAKVFIGTQRLTIWKYMRDYFSMISSKAKASYYRKEG